MPDRIRLAGLIANGAMCGVFGMFAVFVLAEGQPGMAAFFALIAATGAFNWYVIRKSARVLAELSSQRAELQRQLIELRAAGAPVPPP